MLTADEERELKSSSATVQAGGTWTSDAIDMSHQTIDIDQFNKQIHALADDLVLRSKRHVSQGWQRLRECKALAFTHSARHCSALPW